jgi:hypothetical protein
MLRIGSGVVGRRTFEDAAIGDHGRSGITPGRLSGNAALGETTTSTAPHLSVRDGATYVLGLKFAARAAHGFAPSRPTNRRRAG